MTDGRWRFALAVLGTLVALPVTACSWAGASPENIGERIAAAAAATVVYGRVERVHDSQMSNGYLLNSATIRIFRRYKGSSEKGEIELHSGSWACGFSFRHGDELIFFAGPDGLVGATAVELPKAWLLKVLEVSGDSQSKGSAFAQSVKSAM